MFNFFKRKSIVDNAKDFETQYKVAKIIIFKYLDIWFEQIFGSPDYQKIFGETDLHTTLAAQVENYLFGENLDEVISKVTPEVKRKILQVKNHIPKWADDAMNRDKDFCELVIQTIRMDMVFRQYASDSKWLFENPRGKRIQEILTKYGGDVSESPDPKKYDKLLRKWMMWDEMIEQKKKKRRN